MDDSLEVEEILERIRERVRLRNSSGANSGPAAAQSASRSSPRSFLRRIFGRRARPDETLHGSVTRWFMTERALENLHINTRLTNERIDAVAHGQDKLNARLENVERLQLEWHDKVAPLLTRVEALVQDNEKRIAQLNREDSYQGAKAEAGLWFNEPLLIQYNRAGLPTWIQTSERIIEKAWIIRQIGSLRPGSSILDVGCTESLLPVELASNGFAVTGVDIRPYKLHHPNLRFVQGDITKLPLDPNSFDAAILLSTIEHIGLGWYGDRRSDGKQAAAQAEAMAAIHHALKPGGQLFVTVPFGRAASTPLHRIFDARGLRALLEQFEIRSLEYGIKLDQKTWVMPVDVQQAEAAVHHPDYYAPGALALARCEKR